MKYIFLLILLSNFNSIAQVTEGEILFENNIKLHWAIKTFNEKEHQIKICKNDFDVQYIGQSIGNDGTRNFLDRVKNHEKLQQIYVDNENNESKIGILAFKVSKDQTLISIIPPSGAASSNILEDGFNLMENLTIEEIVTLFEASFIKYFRPKYNKYFKDNFPSSNMKCLRQIPAFI